MGVATAEGHRLDELDITESVDALDSDGLSEAVERHLDELAEAGQSSHAAAIRGDGLVPLYVIRPGIGKGRGRHLYEADMLEREVNDGRFNGWKMYLDHQSPEAKRAAAGLPRSVRDLGGFIKEAWWDPTVAPDPKSGHAKGAVIGLAKPTRFMRALIEDIPEAIGASISAQATGVRPVTVGGQQVNLVEGIRPRGSVDWVTEAGAGGRVVSLMESLEESFAEEQEGLQMLEGLTSAEEIVDYIATTKPELREPLLEALQETDGGDDGAGDERAQKVEKYLKKFNGNRKMAERAADREMKEANDRGGNVDGIELLNEALGSEEGQEAIRAAVEEQFGRIVAPRLADIVEAALEDERELMQAEAQASAERQLQVRDMRDAAHAQIRESKLPAGFQEELCKRYDIVEQEGRKVPTPGLNILEDREGDEITKTAEEKLREAVAADIARQRELLAEASPTTVRGQGPRKQTAKSETSEGGSGGGGDGGSEGGSEGGDKTVTESKVTSGSALTDSLLEEAHVPQDRDLWQGI